jgi:hypothetical protein
VWWLRRLRRPLRRQTIRDPRTRADGTGEPNNNSSDVGGVEWKKAKGGLSLRLDDSRSGEEDYICGSIVQREGSTISVARLSRSNTRALTNIQLVLSFWVWFDSRERRTISVARWYRQPGEEDYICGSLVKREGTMSVA